MKRQTDKGAALISAVMVMMLMSALLVGVVALVVADQQSLGADNQQTQAYMGAHAGLEKLTADLGALFKLNYSPSGAQVDALMATANVPNTLPGITFVKPDGTAGYTITYTPDSSGNPKVEDPNGSLITEGPYQGLIGLITPYGMDVTARAYNSAEVRLTRTVQSVAIPVFQFGIFSDKDLGFHAGPDFNFGGRVHTNQNLYLSQGDNATLLLGDRVTAVGEVIRTVLPNGLTASGSAHNGTVRIATQPGGCNGTYNDNTCKPLGYTSQTVHDGSVTIGSDGVPPSVLTTIPDGSQQMVRKQNETKNTGWGTVLSNYRGYLENGVYKKVNSTTYTLDGGTARRLVLPIVDTETGAEAIDLIRRPKVGDATGPGTTFDQRFFRLASLRILLSDTANEIKNLPSIDTSVDPMDLTKYNDTSAGGFAVDDSHPPIAQAGTSSGTAMSAGKPVVSGFLKVERQDLAGVWHDVTHEFLDLGIAGKNIANGSANTAADPLTNPCEERNANAIIRFQRIADAPQKEFGTTANDNCGKKSASPNQGRWTQDPTNYLPMALYDAREGALINADKAGIRLEGVMHYVELDVDNFRRWINGEIGSTGTPTGNAATMNITGYVVYFSDRRGNKNAANVETGELGFEDVVHLNSAMDPGENVNENVDGSGNGILETYGNTPHAPAGALAGGFMLNPQPPTGANLTNKNLRFVVSVDQARKNPPIFFRRALVLVHGGRGQLPHGTGPSALQGLTVASENPVYVLGNYNACGTALTDCAENGAHDAGFTNDVSGGSRHYSAAVIADAVTLLSRKWNDINSFTSATSYSGRVAVTTWYRLAIISGKGINFPWEDLTSAGGAENDRGSDGGVHNFLRFLENWGNSNYVNYWGSMVSLYYNRQAVGIFKNGDSVYNPPNRQFKFDTEFTTPSLLPPRTPMFRDINVLTFRESFVPTQP